MHLALPPSSTPATPTRQSKRQAVHIEQETSPTTPTARSAPGPAHSESIRHTMPYNRADRLRTELGSIDRNWDITPQEHRPENMPMPRRLTQWVSEQDEYIAPIDLPGYEPSSPENAAYRRARAWNSSFPRVPTFVSETTEDPDDAAAVTDATTATTVNSDHAAAATMDSDHTTAATTVDPDHIATATVNPDQAAIVTADPEHDAAATQEPPTQEPLTPAMPRQHQISDHNHLVQRGNVVHQNTTVHSSQHAQVYPNYAQQTTAGRNHSSFSQPEALRVYLTRQSDGRQSIILPPGYSISEIPVGVTPLGHGSSRLFEGVAEAINNPPNATAARNRVANEQRQRENNINTAEIGRYVRRIWTFIRLYFFAYLLSESGTWTRTFFVVSALLAALFWDTNTSQQVYVTFVAPVQRHLEGLAHTGGPADQAAQAGAAVQGMPQDVLQFVRRMERSAVLLLASLVPGIGERQVEARNAAEAEQARQEQEQEQEQEQI